MSIVRELQREWQQRGPIEFIWWFIKERLWQILVGIVTFVFAVWTSAEVRMISAIILGTLIVFLLYALAKDFRDWGVDCHGTGPSPRWYLPSDGEARIDGINIMVANHSAFAVHLVGMSEIEVVIGSNIILQGRERTYNDEMISRRSCRSFLLRLELNSGEVARVKSCLNEGDSVDITVRGSCRILLPSFRRPVPVPFTVDFTSRIMS